MIYRQNWLDTEYYLNYLSRIKQLDPKSVDASRTCLRRLLVWADGTPFPKSRAIEPTFPAFLLNGGIEKKALTPTTMARTCEVARVFFQFMRMENGARYKQISESWIETIRMGRRHGTQSVLKKRTVFTVEDVRQVIKVEPETLTQRRDRAAVAFLFLSGMRVSAFTSLPAECVDVDALTIKQLPEMGVRTKNSKAAVTYLLDLPDLLSVVREWDAFVRAQAGKKSMWYLPLLPDGSGVMNNGQTQSTNRDQIFRRGLRDLCELAGIPYKSPHKLRHGFAVYGVTHAKDIAQFKAVSQNLMHSNMGITDGIYGNMDGDKVKQVISNLGERSGTPQNGVIDLLKQLAELKRTDPDLLKSLLGP